MIDDIVAMPRRRHSFRQSHPDRIGDALSKWSGGGFDPGRMAIFGMSGSVASELAEIPDLFDIDIRVSGQIKQRIEQHRPVSVGQYEPVAIGPGRVGRIEGQKAGKQDRGDVRHAHGHARMAAIGGLHRVHRQNADGVGELGVCDARFRHRFGKRHGGRTLTVGSNLDRAGCCA